MRLPADPLQGKPGWRFIAGTSAVWFVWHAILWQIVAHKRGTTVPALLNAWDAAYYTAIAVDGHYGTNWIFYPLYPFLVRAVRALTGGDPWVVGSILSTVLFALFVAVLCRAVRQDHEAPSLVPRTRMGWLLFLAFPGSYVFHSHHTESLFLLLSFLAFWFSARRVLPAGGFFGALTALARNQGVFVVGASALLAALSGRDRTTADRARSLLVVGLLGALGVAAFLLYQYVASGSPFTFMEARKSWSHASTPWEMVRTLWFGNPWQSSNDLNNLRHLAWMALLVGSALLTRRAPSMGLYCLASLLVMLTQGELINTFRYGAVLFPVLFFLGDALGRAPRFMGWPVLLLLWALNLQTARHYVLVVWAY